MAAARRPVLILGAGINGCALSRELLLSGVPVWLVDSRDIAAGTTAYSSRLIHGGLRYLEYGEFDLVRESLAERTRLLRLAPQFVRPLRLSIPTRTRHRGLWRAIGQFLGWRWWPGLNRPARDRGNWVVRAGLRFYDAYAKDPTLPKSRVDSVGSPDVPPVDPARYRWLCSYYDAQVVFPERFSLALLEDCRRLAEAAGVEFRVLTYHEARLNGATAEISPVTSEAQGLHPLGLESLHIEPSAIINATGAWVDETLSRLPIPSQPLMGGTRGSHLFTAHAGLRAALDGNGIYAEASDGRPIFITPLADLVLIGTTDERFSGDPASAVATDEEIDYLLAGVNQIFPQCRLTREELAFHYCGVRPLPHVETSNMAGVTRRHWLAKNATSPVPVYSIIGGKLTTCRSLAETAAKTILGDLGWSVAGNSEERPIPGAEGYPLDEPALGKRMSDVARRLNRSPQEVRAVWSLLGARAETILAGLGEPDPLITGLPFSPSFVRWVIRHEQVRTLADLVERRLMLLYHHPLNRDTLAALAEVLSAEGVISANEIEKEIQRTTERLRSHFGKLVQ